MKTELLEKLKKIAIFGLAICINGCGKKINQSQLDESFELTAESAITSISGSVDDQNGIGYTSLNLQHKTFAQSIQESLLPKAFAATCSRAFSESCVSGLKTASYSDCDISGTALSIDGSVSLSYSDSGCGLSAIGDSVNRTYDFRIIGPRNGELRVFSSAHTDYRGTSISGGGKLTKTSGGWDLEILGKNNELSRGNRVFMSHSIRTLTPINITGGLDRASRLVNGGQLEVNHNLAKYTAIFTPNNIQYSSTCCHPISGSLTVNYSGSISSSGSITFEGCGSATISQDGKERAISLSFCE